MNQIKINYFLKNICPDFMWCTVWDLYLMYEQIEEDVDEDVFKGAVSNMKKRGYFITKSGDKWNKGKKGTSRFPELYMRVR